MLRAFHCHIAERAPAAERAFAGLRSSKTPSVIAGQTSGGSAELLSLPTVARQVVADVHERSHP